MKASIAVCTYNRAEHLRMCLPSLLKQEAEFDFEIIVIDNRSTDTTKKDVESIMYPGGRLKYVFESRQGLSNARNRALSEANGEIVAFIDDDAIAEPGWISALVNAFQRPGVAAVGGKIVIDYPVERPAWLSKRLEPFISAYDKGGDMTEVDEVYGCNFAVLRGVALKVGGFSFDLGYVGGEALPGEEIDLCKRIIRAGYKLLYIPHAEVKHRISTSHLSKEWFIKRFRMQGIAQVRIAKKAGAKTYDVESSWKDYICCSIIARGHRKLQDPTQEFLWTLQATISKGIVDEMMPGTKGKADKFRLFYLTLPTWLRCYLSTARSVIKKQPLPESLF